MAALAASAYEWQPLENDQPLLPVSSSAVRPSSLISVLSRGGLWFATSATFSTWANTAFLREVGSPALHAAVRFNMSAAIGIGSVALWPGELKLSQFPSRMRGLLLPAMCLLAANVLNSLALQLSGITICYVVKSGIPALTVLACMLRGEVFPPAVFATLVPTILGVALASFSDADYSMGGVLAALGSAIAQTSLNLTSKRSLARLHLSGAEGQCLLTCCCALASLPLSAVLGNEQPPADGSPPSAMRAALLVVSAGLAYHLEYTLNFAFVRLVSPLAFSVTDVARRLAIILTGAALFRKPLTSLNLLGVALALGGVLCFLLVSSTAPPPRKRPRQPGRSR